MKKNLDRAKKCIDCILYLHFILQGVKKVNTKKVQRKSADIGYELFPHLTWGVEGAAIATIISQLFGLLFNIAYLFRMKTIKLSRQSFTLDIRTAGRIASLGFASGANNLNFNGSGIRIEQSDSS